LGGYVLSFLVASGVVAAHIALTSGPYAQASGGMYAFGDLVLFVGVFGIGAIPTTGIGLYFLRPYLAFWRGLSLAAGAIAATNVVAVAVYFASRRPDASPSLLAWSTFSVLRILASPVLAIAFLVSGCVAPVTSSRIALACAFLGEAAPFAIVVLVWSTRMVR